MSAKNLDKHNRWRNKNVAFRVSPEENTQIETAVKLTGLTKQDYIIRRLLCRDVVVQGNPRVYKALRDQLAAVLDELRRIHLLAQMMGSQSLQIPRPLYQTRTKKAIPRKEIWRNFTGRCAA